MTHLHIGGHLGGSAGAVAVDALDGRNTGALMGTPAAASAGTIPSADGAVLSTALMADTDSAVIVVETTGKILFANDLAIELLDAGGQSVVGRNYQEFYPIEFANDRLNFIRNVAATGKPAAVDGMVSGSWHRVTYRRLMTSGGTPAVLMVFTSGPRSQRSPAPGIEVLRGTIDDQGQLAALTHRETEILKLIGDGLSTADIAKELHRSVKTIEWHRVSLGNKLKANNRVELARIAIKAGLSKLSSGSAKIDRPLAQTVA